MVSQSKQSMIDYDTGQIAYVTEVHTAIRHVHELIKSMSLTYQKYVTEPQKVANSDNELAMSTYPWFENILERAHVEGEHHKQVHHYSATCMNKKWAITKKGEYVQQLA